MQRISRFGFASLALGLAVLTAAPAARADESEGMGLQAVAEMMHENALRNRTGWQNGTATLHASGTGYGISYAGTPHGGVGRGPLTIVGNMEGSPMVEYADAASSSGMLLAQRR